MSENHQGYLNGLLSELMGLEASLSQLKGLVKQADETGDDKKCEKFQHELTRLSLRRQELVVRVEQIKQQEPELTEQQLSELQAAWLNIKDAVQQMLDSLGLKR